MSKEDLQNHLRNYVKSRHSSRNQTAVPAQPATILTSTPPKSSRRNQSLDTTSPQTVKPVLQASRSAPRTRNQGDVHGIPNPAGLAGSQAAEKPLNVSALKARQFSGDGSSPGLADVQPTRRRNQHHQSAHNQVLTSTNCTSSPSAGSSVPCSSTNNSSTENITHKAATTSIR